MSNIRKKLIEVALPLEAINVASAREKSIRHGHPSTLHLWWARRPLAACRAVIFASLVDDPDSPDALAAFVEACKALPKGKNATLEDTPRQRLFDFIELLVQWESTTDEDVLNTARELIQIATEGNPPPLLDPFAGGGSIPLEAQRLGLEAHASDLNPVAVMINKAQIEIPPRFANRPPVNPRDRERMNSDEGWKGAAGLAADVRYYGEWMREKAWERIGHLYPTHNGETVIAWLWARTVKCPNPACGAQMPLVSSFELSSRKGQEAWVEPEIDKQAKTVNFRVRSGQGTPPESPKVGRGAKFRCLVCGEVAPDQHIKIEGAAKRMGAQMMAIVTDGTNGRSYRSPDNHQTDVAQAATPEWRPDYPTSSHPQYMAAYRYGMTTFADLLTPRQLVALFTYNTLVGEAREQLYSDTLKTIDHSSQFLNSDVAVEDYANAIATYLAFAADKMVDTNTTICTWQMDPPRLRATFSRQAIPMTWDYAEANVFGDAAGDFQRCIESLSKVLENFEAGKSGIARQINARELHEPTNCIVSTDPPYYDNVPYADLSDFFYVWLRRSISSLYPELFMTLLVPKNDELVADHQRFGSREAANEQFESGMRSVFVGIRTLISQQSPLTVYYAFKQTDDNAESSTDKTTSSTGWETMLEGLISAGFNINGTWPIRSELSSRSRSLASNALASSIVLVCRSRPDDAPTISRRQFVDTLRRELPAALKEMQSGNIAPVDLAQASIGPGMAIYSRYSKVLEADGSAMSVRTALGLINQELDAYLAEQDGDIDSDTRFAVSWFEQFGFNEGEFGQADVLARAKNTSVDGVVAAGVVRSGRGKVRLVHWSEYDAGTLPLTLPFVLGGSVNWDPNVDKRATIWEATHHLIERLNTHGETGSATLMTKMPPGMAAEARNLAYRLYNICERKGWADYARDYNALVISWAGIGEVAARLREAEASGQATEQLDLFE